MENQETILQVGPYPLQLPEFWYEQGEVRKKTGLFGYNALAAPGVSFDFYVLEGLGQNENEWKRLLNAFVVGNKPKRHQEETESFQGIVFERHRLEGCSQLGPRSVYELFLCEAYGDLIHFGFGFNTPLEQEDSLRLLFLTMVSGAIVERGYALQADKEQPPASTDAASNPTRDAAPEPAPDTVANPVRDAAPSPAPDTVADPTPDAASGPVTDAVADPIRDAAPSPATDAVSAPTRNAAPSPAPDAVADPTRDAAPSLAPDAVANPTRDEAPSPVPDAVAKPTLDAAPSPAPDTAANPTRDTASRPSFDKAGSRTRNSASGVASKAPISRQSAIEAAWFAASDSSVNSAVDPTFDSLPPDPSSDPKWALSKPPTPARPSSPPNPSRPPSRGPSANRSNIYRPPERPKRPPKRRSWRDFFNKF